MNLQEVLNLQRGQRQAQQLKTDTTRIAQATALFESQKKSEQIRRDLQPLLDQAVAEYESNLKLINDAAAEATSYIETAIKQLRDKLAQQFPIVLVTPPTLEIKGLTDPAFMGKIVKPVGPQLEEFKDHITPATHLIGRLYASMIWGNTYPGKIYSKLLQGEFIKQDSSEFSIRVDFDEVHLDRFGMLTIDADGFEGNSQISLIDWHKKPRTIHEALNRALIHPRVTKYDRQYEKPDNSIRW